MAPKCSDTEAPSEPPFDVRPKIECPIELGLAPFIQCVKKVSEFGGLRRPTEDEIDLEERIPRLFGSLEPHIETRVFQRDLAHEIDRAYEVVSGEVLAPYRKQLFLVLELVSSDVGGYLRRLDRCLSGQPANDDGDDARDQGSDNRRPDKLDERHEP